MSKLVRPNDLKSDSPKFMKSKANYDPSGRSCAASLSRDRAATPRYQRRQIKHSPVPLSFKFDVAIARLEIS